MLNIIILKLNHKINRYNNFLKICIKRLFYVGFTNDSINITNFCKKYISSIQNKINHHKNSANNNNIRLIVYLLLLKHYNMHIA